MEHASGAQGEAAMRAVVRSELARAAKVPRWTFCAEGASVPTSDGDDSAGDFDTGGTEDSGKRDATSVDHGRSSGEEREASDAAGADAAAGTGGDAALLLASLQFEKTKAAARTRLLALSGDELLKLRINAYAVSSHEAEAQAWRAGATPTLVSPRDGLRKGRILFFNLRPASVNVRWVGYDGNENTIIGPVGRDKFSPVRAACELMCVALRLPSLSAVVTRCCAPLDRRRSSQTQHSLSPRLRVTCSASMTRTLMSS
jgi:hypothetical protein